jgi:hypothetical protein
LTVFSRRTEAQVLPAQPNGQSAIYHSQSAAINSQAIVDASVFYNPPTVDICGAINFILTDSTEFHCGGSGNPRGVVIDARGIGGLHPSGSLQCGTNPFGGCANGVVGSMLSSTILLPAATIQIERPWSIPQNTKVIGEGKNLTTLQACTTGTGCLSNFSGSDMIDLGNSPCSPDCRADGIEHLTLDGNSQNVNGIVNNVGSEELSYVNDVALVNVAGTGLLVQGVAGSTGGNNSGPYSNIHFTGTGTCANINGTVSTRGIHGLTCTSTGPATSAILLDASNNSIEDVYISGPYQNGILVGANASAQSNLLFNINGASGVTNVVAISNAGNPPNVSDLSILGVTTSSTSGTVFTIADRLTNTFLQDGSVGMYVLGEQAFGGTNPGYSRFTTSPSAPAWFVGSGSPSNSCSTGSMYSDNTGTAGATLWVCVAGTWKTVK